MSGYQFVHFLAIDRPLSDEQMKFMQRQSTRARISRREFTNEYHFGDFHGDSLEMMRRGFDLHLHFADFGVRRLMFRLPAGLPWNKATFKPFALKYNLEWIADNRGSGGVLTVNPESDAGKWDSYVDGLEDLLTELTPVREMLIAGDLRPLYLAWLACDPEEGKEPPVPAGLKVLASAIRRFAKFYELSDDLLQAAAKESADIGDRPVTPLPVRQWLKSCTASQRTALLEQILLDETGVARADTLGDIRTSLKIPEWPVTKSSRTIDDLRELVERQVAIRRAAETAAREKLQQQRRKRMKEQPEETVEKMMNLVSQRSTQKYAEAVSLLSELLEVLGPEDGPPFTQAVAEQLRKQVPGARGLGSMLKKSGFLKQYRTHVETSYPEAPMSQW